MNEISIIIVEDNPETCKSFAEYADEMDDISIVSITNNSNQALADIKTYLPNAIILDLELHLGSGNGIELLNRLHSLDLDVYPYIVVTTNNSSQTTYECVRELGADFIMYKHQSDYSEKSVLEFLRIMKTVIKNKSKINPLQTTEAPVTQNKRIQKRITTELNNIGISPNLKGYTYLFDAIYILIQKPAQNLTTIISEKYKKTESSVERAMQNAINKAWKETDIDDLLKYYTAKINSYKGTPTITEFVYYYANKIKNDL